MPSAVRGPGLHSLRHPRPARQPWTGVPQMALKVERWDRKRLGDFSKAKLLSELERQGYSTTVYTFPPGTKFGDHSHSVDKKDSIISGRFLFRMANEEVVLEPGDMLEVPSGRTHYAEVVGSAACTFVDASKY